MQTDPNTTINTMAVAFSCVFIILFCAVACSLTILVRIYLNFDGVGGVRGLGDFLRSGNRFRRRNNDENQEGAGAEPFRHCRHRQRRDQVDHGLEEGLQRIEGLDSAPLGSSIAGNLFLFQNNSLGPLHTICGFLRFCILHHFRVLTLVVKICENPKKLAYLGYKNDAKTRKPEKFDAKTQKHV